MKPERKKRKVRSSRKKTSIREEFVEDTIYTDDLEFEMSSLNQSKKEIIRNTIKKPLFIEYATENQRKLADLAREKVVTFVPGPAGTGKSYVATFTGLQLLRHSDTPYDKMIIVKPAVEVAGENLGFLPGGVEEKIGPYNFSTINIIQKIIGEVACERLIKEGIIVPTPLAFIRGCTFDNAIVIGEEFQNISPYMMKTFLSRIGEDTKYIITGDINQSDKFKNPKDSGLFDAINRLSGINDIETDFKFNIDDIVRNGIIKDILRRYEEDDEPYKK